MTGALHFNPIKKPPLSNLSRDCFFIMKIIATTMAAKKSSFIKLSKMLPGITFLIRGDRIRELERCNPSPITNVMIAKIIFLNDSFSTFSFLSDFSRLGLFWNHLTENVLQFEGHEAGIWLN